MGEEAQQAECGNCCQPATEQYTVVFDSGTIIEELTLCEPCVSAFRETDFLEVEAAPVLLRGSREE